MYEVPRQPPKGRWAAFLHRQRKARDWSQTRAFEELREGLGFGPKSRASYVAIDSGKREPTRDEAAFLADYFGETPTTEDEAPTAQPTDEPGLVAAIREQTQVQRDLVEATYAQTDMLRKVLEALSSPTRDVPEWAQPLFARHPSLELDETATGTGSRGLAGTDASSGGSSVRGGGRSSSAPSRRS